MSLTAVRFIWRRSSHRLYGALRPHGFLMVQQASLSLPGLPPGFQRGYRGGSTDLEGDCVQTNRGARLHYLGILHGFPSAIYILLVVAITR